MSMVESIANVAVGFVLALTIQLLLFPVFEVQMSFGDNMVVALVFAAASVARSFALRRLFEALRTKNL
jgi:hypothetical protein